MTRIIMEDGSPLSDTDAQEITEALYEVAEMFGWSMIVTRDPFGGMEFVTDFGEGV